MILNKTISSKTYLFKPLSCKQIISRSYPGGKFPNPNEITRGLKALRSFYVLDLLPSQYNAISKTSSLVKYNPEITKQYLAYWRDYTNPILAAQIHAYCLSNKIASPIKTIGKGELNTLSAKVVDYITKINPKNEVLELFYLDRQLSYIAQTYDDYLLNLLYKLEKKEPISIAEINYVYDLIEEKFKDKTEIRFSIVEQTLLDFIEVFKGKIIKEKQNTILIESRDDYEFRQLYPNNDEPATKADKMIKKYFSIKKNKKCLTQQDYEDEIERHLLAQDILKNYSKYLTEKQQIEMARRENILINNDAGFSNHVLYVEGQGVKLLKNSYKHIKPISNETEIISLDIKTYIDECIKKGDYKSYVSINEPIDAITLSNIETHLCLAIPHPEDKTKLLIIGYKTSTNSPDNLLLDKIQKDFPISETTDKSNKPQFQQEVAQNNDYDPLNFKETKAQYFTGTKIIIVDKKNFLENTLSTEYVIRGLNSDLESIHNKLTMYFNKLPAIFRDFFQKPIIVNAELLHTILSKHIEEEVETLKRRKEALAEYLKQLNPKKEEALKQLEDTKKNYLLKEEISIKEKLLGEQNPLLKKLIKINKILYEKKRLFLQDKERKNKNLMKKQEIEYEIKNKSEKLDNKDYAKTKRIENTPKRLQITYPDKNDEI